MRVTTARIAFALPLIVLMMGCGDDPVNIPTAPSLPTVTETFAGTLNINGGITHSFVTGSFGTVTSTLTVVSPDTTVLGLALGTWNGISCQIILAADKAALNTSVTGIVSSVGNLCVRVYDVGSLTEATSYEVQVVHP